MSDPVEISVVVPVYGEAESVAPLCRRLVPVLERITPPLEILYVHDGSPDDTLAAIVRELSLDPRITAIT